MSLFVKASLAYLIPVFTVAFVIGAVRVTFVAPALGPLLAVALEVPLILAISWWIAGQVLRRWSPTRAERLAMGIFSFAMLMLLELCTAMAFGETVGQFFTTMTTAAGALGLAGQIGFALIPLIRQPKG